MKPSLRSGLLALFALSVLVASSRGEEKPAASADTKSWKPALVISGAIATPLRLTEDDLAALPRVKTKARDHDGEDGESRAFRSRNSSSAPACPGAART